MHPPTIRWQPPQTGAAQKVPRQSTAHNPLAHQSGFQPVEVQQQPPLWSGYPHPVIALPAADTVPGASYTGCLKGVSLANRYSGSPRILPFISGMDQDSACP